MDDIADLEITVDGLSRNETTTKSFRNIPSSYDDSTVLDTRPSRSSSVVVEFNIPVDLNVLIVDGQRLPDDITILVTGTDGNGETQKALIHLDSNKFIFPDDFPPIEQVRITVVSSSNPSFDLKTEFLGCVHAGM